MFRCQDPGQPLSSTATTSHTSHRWFFSSFNLLLRFLLKFSPPFLGPLLSHFALNSSKNKKCAFFMRSQSLLATSFPAEPPVVHLSTWAHLEAWLTRLWSLGSMSEAAVLAFCNLRWQLSTHWWWSQTPGHWAMAPEDLARHHLSILLLNNPPTRHWSQVQASWRDVEQQPKTYKKTYWNIHGLGSTTDPHIAFLLALPCASCQLSPLSRLEWATGPPWVAYLQLRDPSPHCPHPGASS